MATTKATFRRLGPLPKGGEKVSVRIQPELAARLDMWIADRLDTPSRAEAIRRLIEIGLSDGRG